MLAQAIRSTDPAMPMSSQTIMMPVLSMADLCISMTLKPRPVLSLGKSWAQRAARGEPGLELGRR